MVAPASIHTPSMWPKRWMSSVTICLTLAPSPWVNWTSTTLTLFLSKMTLAADHRVSSTSTPGRMRRAITLPPFLTLLVMNSAASAP